MKKIQECLEWVCCMRTNTEKKCSSNIDSLINTTKGLNDNSTSWKCLSGNYHPNEQAYCRCINKESLF